MSWNRNFTISVVLLLVSLGGLKADVLLGERVKTFQAGAQSLAKKEKYPEAMDELNKALALLALAGKAEQLEYFNTQSQMGVILVRMGLYSDAIRHLESACGGLKGLGKPAQVYLTRCRETLALSELKVDALKKTQFNYKKSL